jgi:serine/threonine protein kinase
MGEQLRSELIDPHTDVGLGVGAYEIITGELPFGGASIWDIDEADGRHEDMTNRRIPIPAFIEDTVGRARPLDPSQRPTSAAELAASLESSELRDSAVELRDGLSELLLAHWMGCGFKLTMQLGARQPQRLDLARALRVPVQHTLTRLPACLLEFVHALLNARIGVDQSLSGVTHESGLYPLILGP